MTSNSIEELISIVTDRELALISCIESSFIQSIHFLCRWYVNMNVLAKTKKYFPGSIADSIRKIRRYPSFQTFLGDWNTLLSSTIKESYDKQLQTMREKHLVAAMSYCEATWLLWKEKLVAFWVNQNIYFGVIVTSFIEGCYVTLKLYLQRGNGDLQSVFVRL